MASSSRFYVRICLCGLSCLALGASLGCQSDYAGQTLPSPYWLVDDVQYFPAGPEFKLTNEAIALKTYGAAQTSRPMAGPLGPQDVAPRPGLVEPAVPAGAPGGQPMVPGAAVPAPPAAAMPPAGEAPVAEPAAEDPFNQ